jgi:hypothetical protein
VTLNIVFDRENILGLGTYGTVGASRTMTAGAGGSPLGFAGFGIGASYTFQLDLHR